MSGAKSASLSPKTKTGSARNPSDSARSTKLPPSCDPQQTVRPHILPRGDAGKISPEARSPIAHSSSHIRGSPLKPSACNKARHRRIDRSCIWPLPKSLQRERHPLLEFPAQRLAEGQNHHHTSGNHPHPSLLGGIHIRHTLARSKKNENHVPLSSSSFILKSCVRFVSLSFAC